MRPAFLHLSLILPTIPLLLPPSLPPSLPFSYHGLASHVNMELVKVRLAQPHGPPQLGLGDGEGVDDLGREGGREGGRVAGEGGREGGAYLVLAGREGDSGGVGGIPTLLLEEGEGDGGT